MIRAAVVGVGYLGRFHAQKYRALTDERPQDVRLIGVYDASKSRAQEVAAELSVPALSSLEELPGKVDAVTIASTTLTHFELARFFLSHKIHVNVEKPMTVTGGEARELVALAKKNNCVLAVGHSERFNPCLQFLQDRFPKAGFLEFRRHAPFRLRGNDVSVVLDLMVHDLDMAVSWTDSLEIETAFGGKVHSSTLDWAECTLKSGSRRFHISVSRVAPLMQRSIRGFNGATSFQCDFQTGDCGISHWKAGSETAEEEIHRLEKRDHLRLETENFVDAILGKKPVVIPGEQGQLVLELALQIEDRILNG